MGIKIVSTVEIFDRAVVTYIKTDNNNKAR